MGGRGKYAKNTPSDISKKIADFKSKQKTLASEAGKKAKVSKEAIERFTRRYGKKGLINAASKKLGGPAAVRLVGKALASIGAAPLTGGLSLLMNAWTLYDLARIAKAGLKEAKGTEGLHGAVFGGAAPIDAPKSDYMSDEHRARINDMKLRMGL